MHYDINPFKDEVLCNISLLEVYDIILGQPYMWKHHVPYNFRPCRVIVTLEGHLYYVLEVVTTIIVSFILAKQCTKVFPQTRRFVIFMIWLEGKRRSL
jgi:hypothetical protein